MSFWYLQFSQKTNKKIWLYYYGTSSRIVFVRFLGELKISKRRFEINWPLVSTFEAWNLWRFNEEVPWETTDGFKSSKLYLSNGPYVIVVRKSVIFPAICTCYVVTAPSLLFSTFLITIYYTVVPRSYATPSYAIFAAMLFWIGSKKIRVKLFSSFSPSVTLFFPPSYAIFLFFPPVTLSFSP